LIELRWPGGGKTAVTAVKTVSPGWYGK